MRMLTRHQTHCNLAWKQGPQIDPPRSPNQPQLRLDTCDNKVKLLVVHATKAHHQGLDEVGVRHQYTTVSTVLIKQPAPQCFESSLHLRLRLRLVAPPLLGTVCRIDTVLKAGQLGIKLHRTVDDVSPNTCPNAVPFKKEAVALSGILEKLYASPAIL
eukprot:CAMPEP_0172941880 /NCGR_PEP_ID=MMETSP1075-20121228/224764_1 /TAXON_ID=2916 /ORGANISM="Ceratium fusus, Strain PA161109" /LENGTH=157 /DNA_ID=CAMNT_0013803299 /DNA_START=303 /DNA_END=776 /DNA_ORIENTATION=-